MPRKQLQVGPIRRVANALLNAVARAGIGPGYLHILTTRGRKTGQTHSHPVQLVIEGESKWLVAPYGTVDWVRNALAAGEVTLTRGGDKAIYRIERAPHEEAGRILKKYVKMSPVVLPYFESGIASTEAEFAAEADEHPVFRLFRGQP